ncbi:hypothetical protein V6N13_125276 [Hibiscus sabdariffa]|uniref:Uncharacterized protein n=1 Tax=Hibiscus sabdariffa TaxID=183260 RepID=A0ABR2U559_9ROSI
MARMIKEGTLQGNKAVFVSKAPTKNLIIPAKELVQVIAKDVAVTSDGFASELQHEKHQELLIDSVIYNPVMLGWRENWNDGFVTKITNYVLS